VLAILIGFFVERRVAWLPLFVGGMAALFGGLTLIFHDKRILMIKPTVMNLAFAAVMFGGLILRRHPLKLLLGDAFDMPDQAWRGLTLRYGVFFAALAAANEAVWRTQSDSVWVLFRFPGLMVLTLAFSLLQAPFLMKHLKGGEVPPPPPPE